MAARHRVIYENYYKHFSSYYKEIVRCNLLCLIAFYLLVKVIQIIISIGLDIFSTISSIFFHLLT